MKIIENLKLYFGEDIIEDVKRNVHGFDYTEFDVADIVQSITPALELRSNWISFGPVHCVGINRQKCKIEKLRDNKLYPTFAVEVKVNIPGQQCYVTIKFNPFECEEICGDWVYDLAVNELTNTFRKFMKEKFGKAYVEANNKYWCTVKQNGVEEIMNQANDQILKLNKEYDENIICL